LAISSVCLLEGKELFDLFFCELLDNAIKFSKPGTVIKIVTFKTDEDISINISNENSFVEVEQLENYQIFQQFNRLEQEQQGLGIGLGLVKHIIKALRGQLSFYKMENVLTVQVKFKNYGK
jgi:K+-sensing histidine kinase KdpD